MKVISMQKHSLATCRSILGDQIRYRNMLRAAAHIPQQIVVAENIFIWLIESCVHWPQQTVAAFRQRKLVYMITRFYAMASNGHPWRLPTSPTHYATRWWCTPSSPDQQTTATANVPSVLSCTSILFSCCCKKSTTTSAMLRMELAIAVSSVGWGGGAL